VKTGKHRTLPREAKRGGGEGAAGADVARRPNAQAFRWRKIDVIDYFGDSKELISQKTREWLAILASSANETRSGAGWVRTSTKSFSGGLHRAHDSPRILDAATEVRGCRDRAIAAPQGFLARLRPHPPPSPVAFATLRVPPHPIPSTGRSSTPAPPPPSLSGVSCRQRAVASSRARRR